MGELASYYELLLLWAIISAETYILNWDFKTLTANQNTDYFDTYFFQLNSNSIET